MSSALGDLGRAGREAAAEVAAAARMMIWRRRAAGIRSVQPFELSEIKY